MYYIIPWAYISSPLFVHRVITTSGVCWLVYQLSTCTATKHSDVYTAETPPSPSSAVALLAIGAATLFSCVILLYSPNFGADTSNNLAVFGCQRICLPPVVATVRHSQTDSCMFKYSGDGKERKKEANGDVVGTELLTIYWVRRTTYALVHAGLKQEHTSKDNANPGPGALYILQLYLYTQANGISCGALTTSSRCMCTTAMISADNNIKKNLSGCVSLHLFVLMRSVTASETRGATWVSATWISPSMGLIVGCFSFEYYMPTLMKYIRQSRAE